MNRLLRDGTLAIAAAWLVAAGIGSAYLLDVASYAAVLALFALGVALTFGQLGYVSFGHAAFLGTGGYFAGLLATSFGMSFWAAVPLAILPGLLLGALIGVATARLGGAYFAIGTLVVSEVLLLIANHWVELTKGPMGLVVSVPPLAWADTLGLNGQQAYLFVLLATLAAVLLLLRNLVAGPVGRSWTAVREAPALAESVGIATARTRVLNVALSGALSCLAGALLVPKVFVVAPPLLGAMYSATGILAVILGGKATLLGPVLGGAIFAALPEALRFLGELNQAAFAILLLLAVRLLPSGIVGWIMGTRAYAGLRTRLRHANDARDATGNVAPAPVVVAAAHHDVVLRAVNISKHYIGLKAVQDVSFSVRSGELVGLIGPNGAGKTTMLSMLSGFTPPTHGHVELQGRDIRGTRPNAVARAGLVRSFQQTALWAASSVRTNMLIASHTHRPGALFASLVGTRAYAARERERLAHALGCLHEVGLAHRLHDTAGSLPYGEQKLLGLAIALAARPAVLLLDEPAAGLNQAEANRLAQVLRQLRAKGMTIVVVDHNLKMMMSLVDRVVVLHHGVKIADGPPQDVVSSPQVVEAYLGQHAMATTRAEAGDTLEEATA